MPHPLEHALQLLAARVRGDPAFAPFAAVCVVGGALRDALLGRDALEVDLAVPGDAGRFAALAAEALGASTVVIGREPWRLHRVPLARGHLDAVAMQGPLADDLARRDFTVNALALPLAALPAGGLRGLDRALVVDLRGGLRDLDARLLRASGPRAFEEDPVRALRGVRIACTLGFAIEPATLDWACAVAPRVGGVAAERVGVELTRIFAAAAAARGARLLDATGLIDGCLPSLAEGRAVEQRPVHRYDVLEHGLASLEWMDALLAPEPPRKPRDAAPAWRALWERPWPETRWGEMRAHLRRHGVALRLATLLHDVGKPRTRTVEPDGRTRFFGHAELGAELAAHDLARWRLPRALVERVALLVAQHLRPGQVASPGQPPTPRALHRFQRALGDATPDVCFLFLADSLATVGADVLLPRWPAYAAHVRRIATWAPPPAPEGRARLVDGRDVIRATGLEPGPAVGAILEALEEAAAAGEVRDRAEALAMARRLAQPSG